MDTLEFELTAVQSKSLSYRRDRQFFIRCSEGTLLRKIDGAVTTAELEEIAKFYQFCDRIDLSPFQAYQARKIMRILTMILYRFPKLAGRLNYVGSYESYGALLGAMSRGDGDCVRALGLQHILSKENAQAVGKFGVELCRELRDETSLAAFVFMGDLCNGLLFDSADYKDYAYLDTIAVMRRNEQNGFHPKGCNTFESVVYHEIGHLLDSVCGFSRSEEGSAFLARYSQTEVIEGLSRYAATSPQEMVAEAVSEALASPAPRRIAAGVYEKLCEFYRKL